jgi:hypothetical protein
MSTEPSTEKESLTVGNCRRRWPAEFSARNANAFQRLPNMDLKSERRSGNRRAGTHCRSSCHRRQVAPAAGTLILSPQRDDVDSSLGGRIQANESRLLRNVGMDTTASGEPRLGASLVSLEGTNRRVLWDGRTFEVATSPDLAMEPAQPAQPVEPAVEPVLSRKGPRQRKPSWLASPTGKLCCIAQTKRYCKDSARA